MLFLMSSGVFSITAISCSPVIRSEELCKDNFSQFHTTAVFLHDIMVPENDVLEVG